MRPTTEFMLRENVASWRRVAERIEGEKLILRARILKLEAALRYIASGKEVQRGDHTEVEDIDDPAEYARLALAHATPQPSERSGDGARGMEEK